jgi:outer membrane receptor for ferrienterochelin and colicins
MTLNHCFKLSKLSQSLAHALVFTAAAASAQEVKPPAPAASAPPAARAATPPARPASAPAAARAPAAAPADSQRIEITGGRNADTDERRQSTAAKIVIGREEIDKYGDSNIGEVLRRLPGVTTPGAPGRGGPPRMRGLGNGFTQLLIDGQRVPPGFSMESLTPDQVERIEVLRAPTAETGAQAIAGTINIITREGYKRRLNDLRGGISYENGKLSPGLNWTHNDSAGDLTYNISGGAFAPRRESSNSSAPRFPTSTAVRCWKTARATAPRQKSAWARTSLAGCSGNWVTVATSSA